MNTSTFIVKVSGRGTDMGGLMRYLYGPGESDEHTNQHMIAGSPEVRFAFSGRLSRSEATKLGRVLESSWREQMAEANMLAGIGAGGVSRASLRRTDHEATPEGVPDSTKEHVYHLIVSLPPGKNWTDEQFATVAGEYVKRLGFNDGEEDDLGCRWWAVRHGQSRNGNEHVHIAVNLIREDGRRARVPDHDFRRVQEIRVELERELEFVAPLHDAVRGRAQSLPAYTMGEQKRTQIAGALAPDRVLLQQHLRAAFVGSETEAEWIERAVDAPGVELSVTRWKEGGRETATGYSARIGEGRWFKASELSPDLTLGRMRSAWDANETVESRARAADLWRDDSALSPLPGVTRATPHLDSAETLLAEWADGVSRLDPAETQRWRGVEGDLAGLTSMLSTDLAATDTGTAVSLVRAAEVASQRAVSESAWRVHSWTAHGPSRMQFAARQIRLALRAGSLHSHPGWIAVMQQLALTAGAAQAARAARGELAAARQLAVVTATLDDATRRLHASYGDMDLAGLREAWAARETAAVGLRAGGRALGSDSSSRGEEEQRRGPTLLDPRDRGYGRQRP